MTFPEHVADARAWDNLQASPALPHAERYFWKAGIESRISRISTQLKRHKEREKERELTEILAAPHVHLRVVLAQFLEIRFVDDEEAARDHRCPDRLRGILLPRLPFRLAQVFPFEHKTPIETTP